MDFLQVHCFAIKILGYVCFMIVFLKSTLTRLLLQTCKAMSLCGTQIGTNFMDWNKTRCDAVQSFSCPPAIKRTRLRVAGTLMNKTTGRVVEAR